MLIKKRQSAVETFVIRFGDGYREQFISVGQVLRLLEIRIPTEATLVLLPANPAEEYKREIHLHRAKDGTYQPIEIAVRKVEQPDGNVIYEYSTDYEIAAHEAAKPLTP